MTPDSLLVIPESLYLRSISPFLTIMQRGSLTQVVRMYQTPASASHGHGP